MPGPTAILDANVLYPAPLRDLLMHLAVAGLFKAKWIDAIYDEWMRNLLAHRPDLSKPQLERTRELMNRAVPDALVSGYEPLVPALTLPDPDDRHVLAAAIRAGADGSSPSTERTSPSGCSQAMASRPSTPTTSCWGC